MGPVLVEFFEAMVHKLNVNSHKRAITDDDIDGLLAKLTEEIQEFRDQRIQDASDPNILAELSDVGNFAFLIYAFLRERGVWTMRERFIMEYFDIDVSAGNIFCKKTRSGSPLSVGQEIKGTTRNGVTQIRAQHTISGATVSLPRRDIIWWCRHGKWPERPLRYVNRTGFGKPLPGDKYPDRIDNLELTPEKPGPRYSFVTQYKPKGRENSKNYGKWRYQRRHALKLITVGYYDTEEEAAELGLKAWKEKTRNV